MQKGVRHPRRTPAVLGGHEHPPSAPGRRQGLGCENRTRNHDSALRADRARRRSVGLTGRELEIAVSELCDRASVAPDFVRELEEYGLVLSRTEGGERLYRESEADVAAACARLARFGVDARHLRAFVTAAARQAALVEQLVAPGLRSRSPERRKSALEDLESLTRVAEDLSQLLLLRDLRAVVERSS